MMFKRKFLLFIMFGLIISSGYLLFVRTITDPQAMKNVPPEKIEDSLERIYENFLHKTQYSYEEILNSGTNYTNQERVFIELTKKMKNLTPENKPEYDQVRNMLLEEIRKNQSDFQDFYLKISKTTPDELKKLLEARNKQFDIILEEK